MIFHMILYIKSVNWGCFDLISKMGEEQKMEVYKSIIKYKVIVWYIISQEIETVSDSKNSLNQQL